ncbi:hypothetical protein GW17_00035083 [Ensete ventricosum]|nr:hypothetical protein GW17_00035083 [Ensete ventricosum]
MERLNHNARRTKVITPQPIAPRPSVPPTTSRPPQLKKLTRKELHDRSAKGLCWHYDELWSCDHCCKKGRLLMIEPIKESEPKDTNLESEKEDIEEDPQSSVSMVQALVGYTNPKAIKIGGLLKHQPITVLIDKGSTNNFMNKVAT